MSVCTKECHRSVRRDAFLIASQAKRGAKGREGGRRENLDYRRALSVVSYELAGL